MNKTMYYQEVTLPKLALTLRIGATAEALLYISRVNPEEMAHYFPGYQFLSEAASESAEVLLAEARQQLLDYDADIRQQFQLPLHFIGTDFQQQVWQLLLQQPYGQLTTYSALAQQLGRPTAVRAVANAVGRNPLMIVVPCHRVVGKNGELTGYRGGIENKRSLLIREGLSEYR